MAWVAVGLHGGESIFESKPIRNSYGDLRPTDILHTVVNLPSGTIEKIIDRPLTWEEEPVEI